MRFLKADDSTIFLDGRVTMHCGDVLAVLESLPADHFDCCITSPPYWGLRSYGVEGQLGLEPTLGEHLAIMVKVFNAVRRVLKPSGTCWINYGDCYATSPNGRSAADTKAVGNDDRTFRDKPFSTVGPIYGPGARDNSPSGPMPLGRRRSDTVARSDGMLKPKDLCMVPNRLAIALQEDGWWVRSEIIWGKRNAMPDSSGKYRPSTAHEKIWLLSKSANCFYDSEAVALPCSSSTHARVSQDIANQVGSVRANGGAKTNGNMKAVTRKSWKGSSFDGKRDRERHPDVGRNRALPGANSMDAALAVMPETRYLRNYEPAPLEVWPMATHAFSEAHFATFPPELVERCLKAGTSEVGCCSKCGAPWERDVERRSFSGRPKSNSIRGHSPSSNRGFSPQRGTMYSSTKTKGWLPSCKCDAGTIPCLVLDLFGGSGTTAMVAAALGRTATLIDLNPDYCRLARARIEAEFMGDDEGRRHMVKQLGKTADPGPLFAVTGTGSGTV